MDPMETVRALCAQPARMPGSDAERRAAARLRELMRSGGRESELETVWVRPHWASAWALLALVGAVASLVAIPAPIAGAAIAGAAFVLAAGDLTGRWRLARAATYRRATQNVVAEPAARKPTEEPPRVRLVVIAAYDAGRSGLAVGRGPRRTDAAVRRALRGHWPSPRAWLTWALLGVTACCAARIGGEDATWLGAVQLVPTVALMVGVALLADLALADPVPDAGQASAAAAALEVVRRLDADPPRLVEVELVLAGAGDGMALGARRYVRARRRRWDPARVALLELRPCGGGTPRWWTHDGELIAPRLHPRLIELAAAAAGVAAGPGGRPHRGRSVSGAYAARQARWPAVAVGALDEAGLVPRAHTRQDTPEAVDPGALRATVELAVAIVGRLDADLAR